jgi:hypothetical protein
LKDYIGRQTEKGLFQKKDKKLTQAHSQLNQILHFLGTSSSSSSSSSPLTKLANKKTPSLELWRQKGTKKAEVKKLTLFLCFFR